MVFEATGLLQQAGAYLHGDSEQLPHFILQSSIQHFSPFTLLPWKDQSKLCGHGLSWSLLEAAHTSVFWKSITIHSSYLSFCISHGHQGDKPCSRKPQFVPLDSPHSSNLMMKSFISIDFPACILLLDQDAESSASRCMSSCHSTCRATQSQDVMEGLILNPEKGWCPPQYHHQ